MDNSVWYEDMKQEEESFPNNTNRQHIHTFVNFFFTRNKSWILITECQIFSFTLSPLLMFLSLSLDFLFFPRLLWLSISFKPPFPPVLSACLHPHAQSHSLYLYTHPFFAPSTSSLYTLTPPPPAPHPPSPALPLAFPLAGSWLTLTNYPAAVALCVTPLSHLQPAAVLSSNYCESPACSPLLHF